LIGYRLLAIDHSSLEGLCTESAFLRFGVSSGPRVARTPGMAGSEPGGRSSLKGQILLNNKELAISEAKRAKVPNGISYGQLKRDTYWEPLRQDPPV